MKNKYNFYEIVKIIGNKKSLENILGKTGVILGMSKNNDGTWGYAVDVYLNDIEDKENSEGWDINEHYLQPTGQFMKREDFYDGSTAKVVVDDKGRGHLKELHLKDDKFDKKV